MTFWWQLRFLLKIITLIMVMYLVVNFFMSLLVIYMADFTQIYCFVGLHSVFRKSTQLWTSKAFRGYFKSFHPFTKSAMTRKLMQTKKFFWIFLQSHDFMTFFRSYVTVTESHDRDFFVISNLRVTRDFDFLDFSKFCVTRDRDFWLYFSKVTDYALSCCRPEFRVIRNSAPHL